MVDIRVTSPRITPIILTLPWQLSLVSFGIFLFTTFGALVVTANPVLTIVGLKVSFFDVLVVAIVVFLLFVLAC